MNDFRKRLTHGFGWVFGITFVGRVVQLAAVAVTTRLLDARDFGLLAVVTAATVLVERITTFGLDGALVQTKEVTPRMLNVVWSYQFARNMVLGIVTFCLAPLLAAFFREPAATDMIRVAAVGFPIAGIRNVGLVILRREMDFRRLGYCNLIPVIIFSVSSVFLTLAMRSVWALVFSSIVLSISMTIVSYFYQPHRPKFDFSWATVRPLFSFGLCLLGNTMLQSVREQGVVFVLGRVISVETLGFYNRSVAFSVSLFAQVQTIFWRVMFPAMSSLQTEPKLLRSVWLKATWCGFGIGLLIIIAYALGVRTFVQFVLGEYWLPIVPIMQILAVQGFMLAVTSPSEVLFQAVGRPIIGTRIQLLSTVVLAVVIWPSIVWAGASGAAFSFAVASGAVAPLTLWAAKNVITNLSAEDVSESPSVGSHDRNCV